MPTNSFALASLTTLQCIAGVLMLTICMHTHLHAVSHMCARLTCLHAALLPLLLCSVYSHQHVLGQVSAYKHLIIESTFAFEASGTSKHLLVADWWVAMDLPEDPPEHVPGSGLLVIV
jgi:hypothetical protein